MTLDQLRTFQAVAAAKSFRGAAEVLHITQPAISKNQALEAELNERLFERRKGAQLTSAGAALLKHAEHLSRILTVAKEEITDIKELRAGHLSIGAAHSVATYVLPGLIEAWEADDAIGRRAVLPALSKTVLRQVVGIVGDVKQRTLIEGSTPRRVATCIRASRPGERRWPYAQRSPPPRSRSLPSHQYARSISINRSQKIRTMVQVLEEKLTSQRFSALLLGVFAGGAPPLAAVGIYSVLSYIVRGRSREIGIRTALGARTADILRLVIVEGMSPALVGIAVGTLAALASAKVLKTLIFGVSASDPLTLAAVAATLALVALMASLAPDVPGSRLDPVKVLRAELTSQWLCQPKLSPNGVTAHLRSPEFTASYGGQPSRESGAKVVPLRGFEPRSRG